MQYTPNQPRVLNGITVAFSGGKKIGVVGRTGCGKSMLIQALFRVVEPLEGLILIDGADILRIGLHDVRSKLSVIPQDPVLFEGTMRHDVDPLQKHSDLGIGEVLRKCHLRQDQRNLDAPVAEDWVNWSLGQLICLARALLRRRRILVLDEATASVDTVTDTLIQETIRKETDGSTVISVAHRIHTVMDNDLVLVLGKGKIVEYDSPSQLLDNNGSAFSSLVAKAAGSC